MLDQMRPISKGPADPRRMDGAAAHRGREQPRAAAGLPLRQPVHEAPDAAAAAAGRLRRAARVPPAA